MDPNRALGILEDARTLANEAVWAIALQRRRLRTSESEDNEFLFRVFYDWQYAIVMLRRLRTCAMLASRVPRVAATVEHAIDDFDRALPHLREMRNVGEHIDDYKASDGRRGHPVSSGQVQVGQFGERTLTWLNGELDIDLALAAAKSLYSAICDAFKLVLAHRDASP